MSITPGSKLTLNSVDYIVESVNVSETNTAYATVSISARTADGADIDPYAAQSAQAST